MKKFEEERLLRLKEILRDWIPVSKSHWWEQVKLGNYPQPVKLGRMVTAWRLSDIKNLMNNGIEGCGQQGRNDAPKEMRPR